MKKTESAVTKRHRWGVSMCLDCGMHRQTVTVGGGPFQSVTEYRKEIILDDVPGTVVMRNAGICCVGLPPGEYKFFKKKALLDTLELR